MAEGGYGCGSLIGILFLLWLIFKLIIWTTKLLLITVTASLGLIVIALIPAVIIFIFIKTFQALKMNQFELKRAIILPSLTVLTGVSIGLGVQFGLSNSWVILTLMTSGISLASLLLYPPLNRRHLIKKYRESEQHLIEP